MVELSKTAHTFLEQVCIKYLQLWSLYSSRVFCFGCLCFDFFPVCALWQITISLHLHLLLQPSAACKQKSWPQERSMWLTKNTNEQWTTNSEHVVCSRSVCNAHFSCTSVHIDTTMISIIIFNQNDPDLGVHRQVVAPVVLFCAKTARPGLGVGLSMSEHCSTTSTHFTQLTQPQPSWKIPVCSANSHPG